MIADIYVEAINYTQKTVAFQFNLIVIDCKRKTGRIQQTPHLTIVFQDLLLMKALKSIWLRSIKLESYSIPI